MKKLCHILLVVLLFSNGCFISKEYPVEYDYNFLGDFDNYKSFDFFMTPKTMEDDQIDLIQSTIKSHLELIGYSYNTENPSFYVNFLYLSDSLRYRGYEQPKMENFVLFKNKNQKEKEEYLKKDLNITNGTLVINFTETSNYSMIWQGYTTDLYSENIFDDPRKVRVAVLSILNNYAYLPMEEKNN
ncbi:hypothetical protein MATR_18230 [Marivirga tractuosa]|uniref:DUF4136 domain-containing protein n=1 Tax=Marivirga tractuosa (strain ATCC 23168 / DSM 4126 / NBRC 15989 / NCIMB 1408 / VKM B-1430 / H-43) TaxID=643867 RepID=E4TPZ7_MARTH|nr:DUF4136 domain-containing protein [Marivirga tractuosa]ADR20554.1 hypothetical protein Ftrac_0550 [Marivirga tractuosa DSM 4126]BDD14998.1 hypothetical protein MATR_18230 [Marivirga tractuosa]